MMSDLVEFLTARLAEDEAVARAAYAGPWIVQRLDPSVLADSDRADVVATDQTCDGWGIAVDHEGFGACGVANAEHIARHDPARILREAEAKRRIIALHMPGRFGECAVCDVGAGSCGCVGWGEHPCDTLKILAQPYADHGDYRAEWATEG